MIHWLVLTGGASTRLGSDKATARLGDRSLTERALDSVDAIDVLESDDGVSVVGPERPGGPAAAVVSMLDEIDQDLVGVLAVDMPFAAHAVQSVMAACRQQLDDHRIEAWVPVDDGGRRQWLCAAYRRSALLRSSAELPAWDGVAFHRLVGRLTTTDVLVESSVSLLDIDTPEDLRRALDIAQGLHGDVPT